MNFTGSKRTFATFITAAAGIERDGMPITVPSRGATLNTWLVATSVPAPGMFSTMMFGIAGDVSDHMSRKKPRPHVVVAAGGRADDDPELLALVEFVGWLRRGRRGAEHAADRQQDGCSPWSHVPPPPVPSRNDRAAPFHGVQQGKPAAIVAALPESLINYCALHKFWADCMAKGHVAALPLIAPP